MATTYTPKNVKVPGNIDREDSKLVQALSQYLGGTSEKFTGTQEDFYHATCDINGNTYFGIYMPRRGQKFPVIGLRNSKDFYVVKSDKGRIILEKIAQELQENDNLFLSSKRELFVKVGMESYIAKACETKPMPQTEKPYVKREGPRKSQEAAELEKRIEERSQRLSPNLAYNTLTLNVSDMQTLVSMGYRVNRYDKIPLGWNDPSETIEFHNGPKGISLIALPDHESTINEREQRTYRFILLNKKVQAKAYEEIVSKSKENLGTDWTPVGYKVLDEITKPVDDISQISDSVLDTLDTRVGKAENVNESKKGTQASGTSVKASLADYVTKLTDEEVKIPIEKYRISDELAKKLELAPVTTFTQMIKEGYKTFEDAVQVLAKAQANPKFRHILSGNKIDEILGFYSRDNGSVELETQIKKTLDEKKNPLIPQHVLDMGPDVAPVMIAGTIEGMLNNNEITIEKARDEVTAVIGPFGWEVVLGYIPEKFKATDSSKKFEPNK